MMRISPFLCMAVAALLATAAASQAAVITPDDFIASGGGTVSLETEVVRFDGSTGIRLDHDFSQGGGARVMPYRVNDSQDAAWTGGDLESFSFWASVEEGYESYIPNMTFYFDDGVSDYYSGSNVTHIVNLWPSGIGPAEGTYNGADWWQFTSDQAWTYYANTPGSMPLPATGLTWADIVSEDGFRPGYGPVDSRPLVELHDALIVGILIGYPGNIGSNVELTAYLDGIVIDGQTFTVVPEPATLALLGLGGLAMIRRRR